MRPGSTLFTATPATTISTNWNCVARVAAIRFQRFACSQ